MFDEPDDSDDVPVSAAIAIIASVIAGIIIAGMFAAIVYAFLPPSGLQ